MSYVRFGPYRNVPDGIARREILRDVQRDRGYLSAHAYEIVDGWRPSSAVVDPRSLSAAELSPRGFRYRIRQRPDPENALGQMGFMFPNDFNVYLHDTPQRHPFDERDRDCLYETDERLVRAVVSEASPDAARRDE